VRFPDPDGHRPISSAVRESSSSRDRQWLAWREPGLLQQVLGHIATVREPGQKCEQADVERIVNFVEGVSIAGAQAGDERQLLITVHHCFNALGPGT
jgi:hypothetical protein